MTKPAWMAVHTHTHTHTHTHRQNWILAVNNLWGGSSCPLYARSSWNLECWFFAKGGKLEDPQKTPWNKDES